MLEKGPLTALLGGEELLRHPCLQENKKVSFANLVLPCVGFENKEKIMICKGQINCDGPNLCLVWII